MREILFRGKDVDNAEWIYGWYEMYPFERFPVRPCIIPIESAENGYYEHVEVDPTTIGQYTGLNDKNGKKIFEGDIVHAVTPNTSKNYCVKFEYGQFCIGINMPLAYVRHSSEVIGNIHDNPELLK